MANTLEARVAGALTNVRNPRVDNDVISAGMVRDLVVLPDGIVSLTFILSTEDPAGLVREAKSALKGVPGVTDVKINVVEPQGGAPARGAPAAPAPQAAATDLAGLGRIVAVSSGKGGVGKSTVSANLAVELARRGGRVGLMDADIYGPNIPRMFGLTGKPAVRGTHIVPLERYGVKVMSLGLLVERDAPAIWRGPIITKIIQQFLRDVDWGDLDYLIVDLPPGTGDAQLSLAQAVPLRGGLIVTTPQEVAIGDALRGAKMFERVNVPVLGVIENMSYFACPHCGKHTEIFLKGGGERLAKELGVPLLGQIPLQSGVADLADSGKPVIVAEPDSPAARALADMTAKVAEVVGTRSVALPILTG
ncbi:MAG: Mrp/NBP35 family ATP-binding protein [Gemmatimonadetes bacterium]|nr:Mrp/NBP35 family ATP-binding protein [Gemmatimonadota bacterium]